MKFFDKYINKETHTNTSAGTFENKVTAIEEKLSGTSSIEFLKKAEQKFEPLTKIADHAGK